MNRPLALSIVAVLAFATAAFAADAPALPLKATAQKHPEDKIAVSVDKGNVTLTITSASGIGDVTLEKTGDTWPEKITVVMQYAEGKPYTKLEGLGGSFVIQGKASIVLPTAPKAGTGEVTIGKDSPGKDAKLLISWVDFFR